MATRHLERLRAQLEKKDAAEAAPTDEAVDSSDEEESPGTQAPPSKAFNPFDLLSDDEVRHNAPQRLSDAQL